MLRVLVCGANSFVSKGIFISLRGEGYEVEGFSRGPEGRDGKIVKGDYSVISENNYLCSKYDVVINYAVIKDGTVDDNLQYVRNLIKLCQEKKVKKLIHFSSTMVYGYDIGVVNENTPIEKLEETWKKGYGEIKIAVDQFLMSVRGSLSFELVIVRPGYVLADNRSCPYIKSLPLGLTLIKGNSKSKLPIVKREDIHKALIKIINTDNNLPVYHLFPDDGITKFKYAKQQGYKHLIPMPKCIFYGFPYMMLKFGLMSKSLYSRFEGMYNENIFSSKMTIQKLGISFC